MSQKRKLNYVIKSIDLTDDDDGCTKPKIIKRETTTRKKNLTKVSTKEKVKKQTAPKKRINKIAKNENIQGTDNEPTVSTSNVKKNNISVDKNTKQWIDELVTEKLNLDKNVVHNVIKLFEAGNTIPFIARYRQHLTNHMSPETLRNAKECYEEVCNLKQKMTTVINAIEKRDSLTESLKASIYSCKNQSELDHIYQPYKQAGKRSLAERAKILGLEEPANKLLNENMYVNIHELVNKNGEEGIRTYEEVKTSLVHLIAFYISTNTEVLKKLRELKIQFKLKIETKQSKTSKSAENDPNLHKFEQYFNYVNLVCNLKPHQILAINRGENLKLLSVKILVPDVLVQRLLNFCKDKWLQNVDKANIKYKLIQEAFKDGYKRLIYPLLTRQIRAELTDVAETASIEVFAQNLKNLLLMPPLKGKTIIGIDPGFTVGCKLAVISQYGELLDKDVIYPNTRKTSADIELFKNLLHKHNCSLIALGNGKGCRETEEWLTSLIKNKTFYPLEVSYTIVDESGASVYSCSNEAQKEFPKLDALVISAISLARRIQDPLAELVKVDPKSLGVGMYQHDMAKKSLENTLNEVVSECVSFVGVDLNTSSHSLLKRVAGLSDVRAQNILNHRSKNGPFTNRYQLKDVKGIGEKIFEQSAGFLRVGPESSEDSKEFYDRPETMPLDCTWIHPESYDLAEKIIEKFNLHYKNIGNLSFIEACKKKMQTYSVQSLASEFNGSEATVQLIVDVLTRPLDHDLRDNKIQEPLFKTGITTIDDIHVGMEVTGRVTNVTHFGAFVDIGIGQNGLIHTSALKHLKDSIRLGQRVNVTVLSIDKKRNRIGLQIK